MNLRQQASDVDGNSVVISLLVRAARLRRVIGLHEGGNVFHRPGMIGEARLHRWGHAEGCMQAQTETLPIRGGRTPLQPRRATILYVRTIVASVALAWRLSSTLSIHAA
jgi:hypothetical protein